MFGVIANSLAIAGGCIVGLIIKGGLPQRVSDTIMNGIALSVLYIGISGALEGKNTLVTIISIAVGALIGELIDIDKWVNKLGAFLQSKFSKGNKKDSIAEGFISSSLLFCIGAMAVVGSLESGLTGSHDTLFVKSVIDGIASIIFTASLGIGVMFSAISVFLYEGIICMGASFLNGFLSDPVVTEMTAAGSLLIIGLGLNVLKLTNIKVANLLPAIFIPILFGVFGAI